MKLVAKEVSFRAGNAGLKSGNFCVGSGEWREGDSYSRMPATVELSNVPWPVAYGLAIMRKVALGKNGLALRRTFVVCPGAMRRMLVLNGLT